MMDMIGVYRAQATNCVMDGGHRSVKIILVFKIASGKSHLKSCKLLLNNTSTRSSLTAFGGIPIQSACGHGTFFHFSRFEEMP